MPNIRHFWLFLIKEAKNSSFADYSCYSLFKFFDAVLSDLQTTDFNFSENIECDLHVVS